MHVFLFPKFITWLGFFPLWALAVEGTLYHFDFSLISVFECILFCWRWMSTRIATAILQRGFSRCQLGRVSLKEI